MADDICHKPKAVDIFVALLMRNVVFSDNEVDTADTRRAAVLNTLRRGKYTVTDLACELSWQWLHDDHPAIAKALRPVFSSGAFWTRQKIDPDCAIEIQHERRGLAVYLRDRKGDYDGAEVPVFLGSAPAETPSEPPAKQNSEPPPASESPMTEGQKEAIRIVRAIVGDAENPRRPEVRTAAMAKGVSDRDFRFAARHLALFDRGPKVTPQKKS